MTEHPNYKLYCSIDIQKYRRFRHSDAKLPIWIRVLLSALLSANILSKRTAVLAHCLGGVVGPICSFTDDHECRLWILYFQIWAIHGSDLGWVCYLDPVSLYLPDDRRPLF